jgi:hypothetical protein
MLDMSNWTVTVETLTEEQARDYGRLDVAGTEGIVVRYHDGRFVKVAEVRDEIQPGLSMAKAARAIAEGYGARYVAS